MDAARARDGRPKAPQEAARLTRHVRPQSGVVAQLAHASWPVWVGQRTGGGAQGAGEDAAPRADPSHAAEADGHEHSALAAEKESQVALGGGEAWLAAARAQLGSYVKAGLPIFVGQSVGRIVAPLAGDIRPCATSRRQRCKGWA